MLEPKHNGLMDVICLACSQHFSRDVEVCKDPVGLLGFFVVFCVSLLTCQHCACYNDSILESRHVHIKQMVCLLLANTNEPTKRTWITFAGNTRWTLNTPAEHTNRAEKQ